MIWHTRVADALKAAPDELLQARFDAQAANFRLAAASYLADDRSILDHQRRFGGLLRRLYAEAQHEGDFVLLLMV